MNTLGNNLYNVMEIGRHSTTIELRKSYKGLSKRYHPDKNPGLDAQLAFRNIKDAYEVCITLILFYYWLFMVNSAGIVGGRSEGCIQSIWTRRDQI